jgi:hypothetical protein
MHIEDPYVEIIGTIKEDRTIKALTSINMGKNLGTSWNLAEVASSATN